MSVSVDQARVILERIRAAQAQRAKMGLPDAQTNAYRLIHGAGDGLPGFTVDVYDQFLVVSSYVEDPGEDEQVIDALKPLGYRGVYLKRRPKQANVMREQERRERASEHAVWGEDAPATFSIAESAMPFLVRLGDGMSTGLFLDQRENRERVRSLSRDRRVLNLFSYTCAFGIAAALGGARATTNIDVSKGVLERGKEGYRAAQIALDGHTFLARDVLETLPKLAKRTERYDLVILDPPSYASTRRGRFSVEQSFDTVVADALRVLDPGGILLACTNHSRILPDNFERIVQAGALQAGVKVAVEICGPPSDHPCSAGGTPHLKTAWVHIQ